MWYLLGGETDTLTSDEDTLSRRILLDFELGVGELLGNPYGRPDE